MSDKNNYIFYKIECIDKDKHFCYVGSTCDWYNRIRRHKNDCYNENRKNYNSKIYKTIRDNGGWKNFKFIQIDTKEEITKDQAHQIEENYRISLNANLNTLRCFLTEKQKQEHSKERYKEYKQNNKDKIKERSKDYYENNKEYYKEYRENNKDKINEKKSQKFTCECGKIFRIDYKSRHCRSKIHQSFVVAAGVDDAGVDALILSDS